MLNQSVKHNERSNMKSFILIVLFASAAVCTTAQTKQYLTYDGAGRVVSAVYIRGTDALRINYSYDNRGHISGKNVEKVTTVDEVDPTFNVVMSPHPVKSNGTLRIAAFAGEQVSVTITNAEGAQIQTLTVVADSDGRAEANIAVDDMSNGVYFATAQHSRGRSTKAFVVAK